MSLITQACLIPELASKANGPDAAAGTMLLGKDGLWHAFPTVVTGTTPTTTYQDEGAVAGPNISTVNFTGSGVTATASAGVLTVTIPGGGGGGGDAVSAVPIQDEGVIIQTAPTSINFVGTGVTATTSGTNVTVTIPGTGAAAGDPYATNAQAVAGTSTSTVINPATLYARESIPAQTGLGLVLAAIPAPTAAQSPWGTNTLGETLHYAPGLGWKIVADLLTITQNVTSGAPVAIPSGSVITAVTSYTAPRAGKVVVTSNTTTNGASYDSQSGGIRVAGTLVRFDNSSSSGPAFTPIGTGFYYSESNNASCAWTGTVAAGTVISNVAIMASGGTSYGDLTVTYIP
jgi:hypothetical protein